MRLAEHVDRADKACVPAEAVEVFSDGEVVEYMFKRAFVTAHGFLPSRVGADGDDTTFGGYSEVWPSVGTAGAEHVEADTAKHTGEHVDGGWESSGDGFGADGWVCHGPQSTAEADVHGCRRR